MNRYESDRDSEVERAKPRSQTSQKSMRSQVSQKSTTDIGASQLLSSNKYDFTERSTSAIGKSKQNEARRSTASKYEQTQKERAEKQFAKKSLQANKASTHKRSKYEMQVFNNMKEETKSVSDLSTENKNWSNELNLVFLSDTNLHKIKHYLTLGHKVKTLIRSKKFTQAEFDELTKIIYKSCLKPLRDMHELHQHRLIALKLLKEIIVRSSSKFLTIHHVVYITWSVMSCIHHFHLRLRLGNLGGLIFSSRKKQLDHTLDIYRDLIDKFHSKMRRVVLNAILMFFKEGRLWETDFNIESLIVCLLKKYKEPGDGLQDIIYATESSTLNDTIEAKSTCIVLSKVLIQMKWNKKDFSQEVMNKFLYMLESSINPQPDDEYNYPPLRYSIKLCITNIIKSLGARDLHKLLYLLVNKLKEPRYNIKVITVFGNFAEMAANVYKLQPDRKDLSKGPLQLIFDLFSVNNFNVNFFAARIWQNLIDRSNNKQQFYTPKVFFNDTKYKINMAKVNKKEKAYFKTIRTVVYTMTMHMFKRSTSKYHMENIYQAVALTMVEIPCGYTASCFVSVAMSLQDFAFDIMEKDLVRSHHLHAIVVSLLTLLCYIHKADVFYNYVFTILDKRAEWAPHLNPPLKVHYEYPQHHILWNKRDLFFEDWEARFGLWKCFRANKIFTVESNVSLQTSKKRKRKPTSK